MDVNPYAETGIDLEQMHFLDVVLTHCLLSDSPALSRQQQQRTKQNLNKVATCGRDLSLQLLDDGIPRPLRDWGEEIFADLAQTAQLLDTAYCGKSFQVAVDDQQQKLSNPEMTPSARMLKDMHEQQMDVSELAMNLAKSHRQKLLAEDYSRVQASEFAKEAVVSQQRQRALEEADNLGFDYFLRLALAVPFAAPSPPQSQTNSRCAWPSSRYSAVGVLYHADMFCKKFASYLPTAANDPRTDFSSDQATQV